MCLIKLLPFPTQLRNAAHDILFDQEPCSRGSNLSCVPSSHIAEPWSHDGVYAGSSQVSWIAQTVMSFVSQAHVHRFVNVLLHFQTAHVPRPNVYCTAVYGLSGTGY
jgi:hypothetical protein